MSEKCPNCGHCPHCGRSDFGPYRPYPTLPYTQPWFVAPYYVGDVWPYPYTTAPNITYTSSSTNLC